MTIVVRPVGTLGGIERGLFGFPAISANVRCRQDAAHLTLVGAAGVARFFAVFSTKDPFLPYRVQRFKRLSTHASILVQRHALTIL